MALYKLENILNNKTNDEIYDYLSAPQYIWLKEQILNENIQLHNKHQIIFMVYFYEFVEKNYEELKKYLLMSI